MSQPQRSRRFAASCSFTFVPMPSALAAMTGFLYLPPSWKSPLKGPASLSTSGRRACERMPGRLLAKRPRASRSTPAAAYRLSGADVSLGWLTAPVYQRPPLRTVRFRSLSFLLVEYGLVEYGEQLCQLDVQPGQRRRFQVRIVD